MTQIHNVIPLVNPSFEDWNEPLVSGRAQPTGWTLEGPTGRFYTDVEYYTRKTETSLKVTGGAGVNERTWIGQKIAQLPGIPGDEEYGFAGWVCPCEFPLEVGCGEPLRRMRLEFALAFDGREADNIDGLTWESIDALCGVWKQFGTSFGPDKTTVTLFVSFVDTMPGTNVAYFDHFDDPDWLG